MPYFLQESFRLLRNSQLCDLLDHYTRVVSIYLRFSLFRTWLSITAEEITKLLEDIIIFISSEPDELSMSRMHEKMHKEMGLQERNKNMEKQARTKEGEDISHTNIKMRAEVLLFMEATALL